MLWFHLFSTHFAAFYVAVLHKNTIIKKVIPVLRALWWAFNSAEHGHAALQQTQPPSTFPSITKWSHRDVVIEPQPSDCKLAHPKPDALPQHTKSHPAITEMTFASAWQRVCRGKCSRWDAQAKLETDRGHISLPKPILTISTYLPCTEQPFQTQRPTSSLGRAAVARREYKSQL